MSNNFLYKQLSLNLSNLKSHVTLKYYFLLSNPLNNFHCRCSHKLAGKLRTYKQADLMVKSDYKLVKIAYKLLKCLQSNRKKKKKKIYDIIFDQDENANRG